LRKDNRIIIKTVEWWQCSLSINLPNDEKKRTMGIKGKDMIRKPLFIRVEWDEEARVWVATSDDVPGLATEGPTIEELIEKLKIMIPELLDTNQCELSWDNEVPFEILSRRFEIAQRPGC
jgi:predicted RNase H-like HicB family nuclease